MRALAALIAGLIAVALAAVPAPTKGAPETITFGSALSLSGPLTNEGHLIQEGYEFWKDYVNARGGLRVGAKMYRIQIKYYDDESNAQNAARLAERLIDEDHVDFMLGPYGTVANFAVAAVVERKGVPMADSSGASEKIFNQGYRYTFGVQSPARKYLAGMIEYAVRRDPKPKTVAIVAASDTVSLEVQQGGIESANNHGIKVVYAERYPENATDVSGIIAGIKAANPDMILNAGHFRDAVLIHEGLRGQNVLAKIYGYTVGPDTPKFREELGRSANYVLGSAQWSAAVTYRGAAGFIKTSPEYARAFTRAYGRPPGFISAEATAACLAFQYALTRARSLDRGRVRDALANLDVVTFFGLLKFDARGINVYKPMVVNQIQDGHLRTIYPYRLAEAAPLYPTPPWGAR